MWQNIIVPILYFLKVLFCFVVVDFSHIPANNGTKLRSGWTKIQEMYESIHPNIVLVLLFVCAEVECRKGLHI